MAGIRNERLPSKAAFHATIESCAGRAYENPVSQRLRGASPQGFKASQLSAGNSSASPWRQAIVLIEGLRLWVSGHFPLDEDFRC